MTREALSFAISNGLSALVLAAVAWLAGRKLKSPALTHALWLLVLVKLVSPPLVDVPLPSLTFLQEPPAQPEAESNVKRSPRDLLDILDGMHPAGRESMQESLSGMNEPIHARTHEPVKVALDPAPKLDAIQPDATHAAALSSSELLCIVWATGTALWFTVAAYRIARFRKLLAKTQPAEAALHAEVEGLAQQIRLPRVPRVCIVNGTLPPLTWALWGQPVILLPRQLLNELTDAERHVLLAHELAHLIRRDHLARWLELLAVGINWWQPAAWIAQRQLHRTSEECCDAWVVRQFPQLARPYAEALLKTVDFLAATKPALPIGSTGFGEAHHLKRRFTMILSDHKTDRMTWLGRFTVLAISCIALPLSVQTLWAETPKPATETAAPLKSESAATSATVPDAEPVPTSARVSTTEERLQGLEGDLKELVKTLGFQQMQTHGVLKKLILELDSLKARDGKFRGEAQPSVTPSSPSIPPTAATTPPTTVERRLQSLEKDIKGLTQVLESREKQMHEAIRKLSLEIDSVMTGSARLSPKVERPSSQEVSTLPLSPTNLQQRRENAAQRHQELVEARELAIAADVELELGHKFKEVIRDLNTKMSLSETLFNRKIAATKQFEAAQSAYDHGTVTLDLLLEAQRRECDAHIAYNESILEIANYGENPPTQIMNQVKLPALKQGRDRALATWKKVHGAWSAGQKGGEPDKEAQAREQYFYFRDELEKVMKPQSHK